MPTKAVGSDAAPVEAEPVSVEAEAARRDTESTYLPEDYSMPPLAIKAPGVFYSPVATMLGARVAPERSASPLVGPKLTLGAIGG